MCSVLELGKKISVEFKSYSRRRTVKHQENNIIIDTTNNNMDVSGGPATCT